MIDLVERLEEIVSRLERITETKNGAPPRETSEFMTIREAAKHFRLSEQYLYRNRDVLVKAGRAVRVDVKKLRHSLSPQ